MALGTLAVSDTLASAANTIVAEFGEQRVFEEIQRFLTAHNEIMEELLSELCSFTDDRLRRTGEVQVMEMQDAGEFHTPEAQKVTPGATVAFPLRRVEIAVQWTRDWLANHVVSELTAQFDAVLTADRRRMVREIKRALFGSSNFTFNDMLVDRVDLGVKRLTNADGDVVPIGAEGQQFNADTHTHYLGTASFVNADLVTLVEHVIEHGFGGNLIVYINRAQETAIRAFADFNPYTEARIINAPGSTADRGRGTLITSTLLNRAIGIFQPGAEVWVKPWMPSGYCFAFDTASSAKPLVYRNRRGSAGPNPLEMVAEIELYPLRSRAFSREYGVGVWNRANGAILDTANANYTDPTIND